MITDTGEGLGILITSEYNIHHDWMAFASWYSIRERLPDAKVAIVAARSRDLGHSCFNWCHKCNVNFLAHSNVGRIHGNVSLNKIYSAYVAVKEGLVPKSFIVLDYDMMAVRSFSDSCLDIFNDESIQFASNECSWFEEEKIGNMLQVGPIWFFRNPTKDKFTDILNTFMILAKEHGSYQHLDMFAISEAVCKNSDYALLPELGVECGEKLPATFLHYRKCCGNFDKNEWIGSRKITPFRYAKSFKDDNLTVSELHILELWKKMHTAYEILKNGPNQI